MVAIWKYTVSLVTIYTHRFYLETLHFLIDILLFFFNFSKLEFWHRLIQRNISFTIYYGKKCNSIKNTYFAVKTLSIKFLFKGF